MHIQDPCEHIRWRVWSNKEKLKVVNYCWEALRGVKRSQTLERQSPQKAFITFTKWKSRGGCCKATTGSLMRSPKCFETHMLSLPFPSSDGPDYILPIGIYNADIYITESLLHLTKHSYSRFSNRRGGGINGEAGNNTAIANFIKIKSSNDLVKISTKKT